MRDAVIVSTARTPIARPTAAPSTTRKAQALGRPRQSAQAVSRAGVSKVEAWHAD